MAQKIIKVGSSAGVTIPKKQLEELGLQIGDEVNISIEPTVKLTPEDKRVVKLTQNFIKRYKKDLDNLAKR